jgi:hypothetical protein
MAQNTLTDLDSGLKRLPLLAPAPLVNAAAFIATEPRSPLGTIRHGKYEGGMVRTPARMSLAVDYSRGSMLKGFDLIQQEEAGATFVTADLHVHSYGFSSDVKDSSMTVEAIDLVSLTFAMLEPHWRMAQTAGGASTRGVTPRARCQGWGDTYNGDAHVRF